MYFNDNTNMEQLQTSKTLQLCFFFFVCPRKLQEMIQNLTIESRKHQRGLDELRVSLTSEKLRAQELEIETVSLNERLEFEQSTKTKKMLSLLDVAYRDNESGELGSKMEEIRQELIATFQGKENEYLNTIQKLRTCVAQTTQLNRVLSENFLKMRYELEDHMPTSTVLTELPKEKDLKMATETEREEQLRLELDSVRKKLQERLSELSMQQEKNLQVHD